MKKKTRNYILGCVGLVLLVTGWWTYRLVWGKPLNINHFYERVFIEYVLDTPELLSQLGMIDNTVLDFHSDDLTDASPNHAQKLIKKTHRDLATLRSYHLDSQTESQRLSTAILAWYLDAGTRAEAFLYHDYPVNQLYGVHIDLPNFMDATHQVIDQKSARNYIARLSKFGKKFEEVLQGLKQREEKGIIPPRFVIEKTLTMMSDFVSQPFEDNILYTSFRQKLENLDELNAAKKAQFLTNVRKQIAEVVYPAYQVLISYLEELRVKATTEDGVWKLPQGDAYYSYLLRSHTTLDYTPEEVHQLGLQEVTRIQSEMREILQSLGYHGNNVATHMKSLAKDKRFLFDNDHVGRKQILETYQEIIDEIDRGLDGTFDVRPKIGVQVKRIPEFQERTTPAAYYHPPAMDGSRPGVFYVNLRDVNEICRFHMRTLAYHEAIPGHHWQLAIQQHIQDVPTFRKVIPFTAYAEGWALYAERLAWEEGFQNDPYSNLGRLEGELWRAERLVVDTGIHYKKWTREQAIQHMLSTTGMAKDKVITEIDRYIVFPAQSCAYTVGMLKILELREKVKDHLGDKFDIREFHNVILKNGAMPLTVLEEVVDAYLKSKVPI